MIEAISPGRNCSASSPLLRGEDLVHDLGPGGDAVFAVAVTRSPSHTQKVYDLVPKPGPRKLELAT
jgi:hypothetical protein